jgi:hypothetical protein
MKKSVKLFALFLMTVFHTSCGQNQTTKDKVTSPVSNERNIYSKYEYTDSNGKRLMIQNGFPRGDGYTDPNGKKYFKVIFWTRIINETDNPLELKINFPVDSYEDPSLPGKYFKILVLPDTMTVDKEPLYNYGVTDLKFFLDNSIYKPSSLKRTIKPNESSGFYVVVLRLADDGKTNEKRGILRTGLSLKGGDLFYRISRYASTPTLPLIDEKEILCGSINVKNFMLRK